MKKTLVIGIGSILRGDDAIGTRIIDSLEEGPMSSGICLCRGDLSGLDLIKYFSDYEKVYIIDAADMGKKPGEIAVFSSKNIQGADFKEISSTHGMGLLETLTLADKLDIVAEIVVIGIQPKDTSFNLKMSKELKDRMPSITDAIRKTIS